MAKPHWSARHIWRLPLQPPVTDRQPRVRPRHGPPGGNCRPAPPGTPPTPPLRGGGLRPAEVRPPPCRPGGRSGGGGTLPAAGCPPPPIGQCMPGGGGMTLEMHAKDRIPLLLPHIGERPIPQDS